jgi:hypothetical protein
MTKKQAKERGFTHKGTFLGVPAYLTKSDNPLVSGTNWFYDMLIISVGFIATAFELEMKVEYYESL